MILRCGGWNSRIHHDKLPQQSIGYMENIALPPTRLDVVQETVHLAQKVARECGEKYTIVSYDLATAKPALQIQSLESPKNLMMYWFLSEHFSSCWHTLAHWIYPWIIRWCWDSMHCWCIWFCKGKHYNRRKGLHLILATGLQILHFRQFMLQYGVVPDSVQTLLNTMAKNPSQENLMTLLDFDVCEGLLPRYKFTEATSGEHDRTAMFWIQYLSTCTYCWIITVAPMTWTFIFMLLDVCVEYSLQPTYPIMLDGWQGFTWIWWTWRALMTEFSLSVLCLFGVQERISRTIQ